MPEIARDCDNRTSGLTYYMHDESAAFRFELVGSERLYGVAAWLFAAAFALSTVCAVITTLQGRDFSADEVNGPSIQFLGKAQ